MSKLKMWNLASSWEEAEALWEKRASAAELDTPIKKLMVLPSMPGITEETAKHLKWKSLKWIIAKDLDLKIIRSFFKHPFKYGWAFLKSIVKKKAFLRDGDFFFYGIKNTDEFKQLIEEKENLLVVGFSYCHKPFECPSGRFTDKCVYNFENPICSQCFIGKCVNALPDQNTIPLFIPTIHYIGGKILDLMHANPKKQIVFLITACEMTLQMFADLGNMANIKGIGVRLDGRICNTMKAFELSEQGIKPGLTVVLEPTKKAMLDLIRHRREQTIRKIYNET